MRCLAPLWENSVGTKAPRCERAACSRRRRNRRPVRGAGDRPTRRGRARARRGPAGQQSAFGRRRPNDRCRPDARIVSATLAVIVREVGRAGRRSLAVRAMRRVGRLAGRLEVRPDERYRRGDCVGRSSHGEWLRSAAGRDRLSRSARRSCRPGPCHRRAAPGDRDTRWPPCDRTRNRHRVAQRRCDGGHDLNRFRPRRDRRCRRRCVDRPDSR